MTPEQIAAAGGLYKDCWTVRDEFAAMAVEQIWSENPIMRLDKVIKLAYLLSDEALKEREREE